MRHHRNPRRRWQGIAAVAALCAALAAPLAVSASTPARADERLSVKLTLYGFPDNSPPGREIDCGRVHDEAGGTGTFDDPVTFATGNDQNKVMPCGTIIYVPFLEKYFIREDSCATCKGPWTDLWAGGNGKNSQEVLDCEDSLTRDKVQVVIDPDPDLDVDTTPIFDTKSRNCFQP